MAEYWTFLLECLNRNWELRIRIQEADEEQVHRMDDTSFQCAL
jgi:hypothetical protein